MFSIVSKEINRKDSDVTFNVSEIKYLPSFDKNFSCEKDFFHIFIVIKM